MPAAPASSGATGSQPAVLNPGAETWLPASVAPARVVQSVVAAVLCTCQPARPSVSTPVPGPAAGEEAATSVAPVTVAPDRGTPGAVAATGATPRAHSPMTLAMTLANRSLAVTGILLMSHGPHDAFFSA